MLLIFSIFWLPLPYDPGLIFSSIPRTDIWGSISESTGLLGQALESLRNAVLSLALAGFTTVNATD